MSKDCRLQFKSHQDFLNAVYHKTAACHLRHYSISSTQFANELQNGIVNPLRISSTQCQETAERHSTQRCVNSTLNAIIPQRSVSINCRVPNLSLNAVSEDCRLPFKSHQDSLNAVYHKTATCHLSHYSVSSTQFVNELQNGIVNPLRISSTQCQNCRMPFNSALCQRQSAKTWEVWLREKVNLKFEFPKSWEQCDGSEQWHNIMLRSRTRNQRSKNFVEIWISTEKACICNSKFLRSNQLPDVGQTGNMHLAITNAKPKKFILRNPINWKLRAMKSSADISIGIPFPAFCKEKFPNPFPSQQNV